MRLFILIPTFRIRLGFRTGQEFYMSSKERAEYAAPPQGIQAYLLCGLRNAGDFAAPFFDTQFGRCARSSCCGCDERLVSYANLMPCMRDRYRRAFRMD